MNNSMSLSVNMSNETFDIADYIAKRLSDRYVSTTQLIVLNIIYIGIFISGIVGNICTCIVIARNRNMHTATNFYLVSLAVSDLLTLIIGKIKLVINLFYYLFNDLTDDNAHPRASSSSRNYLLWLSLYGPLFFAERKWV